MDQPRSVQLGVGCKVVKPHANCGHLSQSVQCIAAEHSIRPHDVRVPSAIQSVLPPVLVPERTGNNLTDEHNRCGRRRREVPPEYPELRPRHVARVAPELLVTEIQVALASSQRVFDPAID